MLSSDFITIYAVYSFSIGYIDPEYTRSGKVTLASDIYSLGIVMLELLSSKAPRDIIVDFEEAVEDEDLTPFMRRFNAEAAAAVISLAKRCTNSRSSRRPAITEVARDVAALCDRWACRSSQLHNQALSEEVSECVVCLDAPSCMAIVPCGHKCLCAADAEAITAAGAASCPVCRGPIERMLQIFESS